MSTNYTLDQAIQLRQSQQYEAAELAFQSLIEGPDQHGAIYYHYAWLCDVQGKEAQACPLYEKALQLGDLNEEDALGCYIGLGSTYRNLGQLQQSIQTLETGLERYPNNVPLQAFLALSLYDTGEFKSSTQYALNAIIHSNNKEGIGAYAKALQHYADELQ